jgi:hypothetical protein
MALALALAMGEKAAFSIYCMDIGTMDSDSC